MGEEFYGILVEIKPPEAVCFIAIPFAADFNEISTCIQDAANRCGLTAVRMDFQVNGSEIVPEIFSRMRSARLVVAVCSPEKSSRVPNPNVMYEVGLAHSLAKPTLMLSSSAQTIPFNVRNSATLIYTRKDVNNRSQFVPRLENAMRTTLDRSPDGLIVDDSPEVSVVHAADRRLLNPAFWGSFQAILDFANEVHREIQGVNLFHLDGLWKAGNQMAFADRGRLMESVRQFTMRIDIFRQDWIQRTHGRVVELGAQSRAVQHAFDDLLADTAGAMRTRIEDARGCFSQIAEHLVHVLAVYDQATTGGDGLVNSAKARVQAYDHIMKLFETTQLIVKDASTLMQDLIAMITQRPQGTTSPVAPGGGAPRKPAAGEAKSLAKAKGASR